MEGPKITALEDLWAAMKCSPDNVEKKAFQALMAPEILEREPVRRFAIMNETFKGLFSLLSKVQ